MLAARTPSDVQARIPDTAENERTRIECDVSPLNFVGPDIAVKNSLAGIDVVFILANQLERVV